MSDSIGNILGQYNKTEPPEFAVIRAFVKQQCGFSPVLSTHPKTIVINAPSAALAGQLRFKLHELQTLIDKKLVIRIQ